MVFIGFLGLTFSKKTTIHLMLCVELIFIGNFLSIIFAGVCLHTYEIASAAYIYSLYILTVAASESAIGLSILIVNYRFHGSIALSRLHTLNG
jgi:NADH-quinone oxidoreductase subunit K